MEALQGHPTPNGTALAQIHEAHVWDSLFTLPGVVVAQGTNQTPTANGLLSYRVEEVTLPTPEVMDIDRGGGENWVTVERVWRFIVTGTGFPIPLGQSSYDIWLDDTRLGSGAPHAVGEMTTIVFDRALLREGGTIYLSTTYSEKKELPERFHFN